MIYISEIMLIFNKKKKKQLCATVLVRVYKNCGLFDEFSRPLLMA